MQSEQKRRMKPFFSLNTHDAMDDTMTEDNQQSSVSTFYSQFCTLNGPNALYWDEIRKDRSRFHRGDDNNFDNIRPSILRSWKRSRAANVPCTGVPMALLSHDKLQEVLQRNKFYLETAKTIMEGLLENILPSNNCIILTDADGVYLHTLGAGEGFGRGSSCPLRGLISGETIDGTTSMGICLVEKTAACVLGYEHYNPHFDGWSCAAAPVFDPENNFAGTLSLTMERDRFHHHTFGLVIAAAKAITEQMRLRYLLQETQTIMELLAEAVVVLDGIGTIRFMNRYAKRLFQTHEDVTGCHLSEIATEIGDNSLFLQGKKIKDGECSMRLASGAALHCMFSSSPMPDGGQCITLRESRRMHKLANRMTGAKAVYDFSDIQGESDSMRQALRLAKMASANSITTLILGESGVGKELFAQAIHNGGARHGQPFIVVNCGAIPRDLVQSELFGYEPGAFTGATRQGAPGKFELADGGTLFLDEIGDMPLTAQVSLLRVLQEGEVTRIGGKHPSKVDVRVVAATHRDLDAAVENGTFRHDLYYRLNVLVITVPSLRERKSDIPDLANFFLSKIANTLCKPLLGFTSEAMARLEAYAWPGNVRELENMVERTAVVATGPRITKEDLPVELLRPVGGAMPDQPRTLVQRPLEAVENSSRDEEQGDWEDKRIHEALRSAQGNVRAAAKELGISRVTLYAKIKRFGICLDTFRKQL